MWIGLFSGLACGALVALADRTVFASVVPDVQRHMLATMGIAQRFRHGISGAFEDEVMLRLIVLFPLVWLLGSLRGRADRTAWWAAIGLVAFVAWPWWASSYLGGIAKSVPSLSRELALHGGAGLLWGWLCWRHGWIAALAGHASAQVALQSLLVISISN